MVRGITEVQKERLTEPATATVLARVREMLVTGQLPAGSKLKAEALAQSVGVSRTPVRSALAILTAEGLVEYHVNRGYTVAEISFRDILDAISVRAVLGGHACGVSIDYGWNEEGLADLQACIDASSMILDQAAWSAEIERNWYEINYRFHSIVIHAARNTSVRNAIRMTLIHPVFGDIARLSPVVAKCVPQRYRLLPDVPPQHVIGFHADFMSIMDALKADDANRGEALMRGHIIKEKERLATIATLR